ncbi:hypothetical protein UFOVP237_66 [uncultured Caudovirales phage]|uniref:Large polyvalent protein associated domain-containing protein n=1 Tax=uncultured Caudovirales phage TaxID=2100421 RepID=A0A6J7WPT4_9CAUD|nr:hypothetical protein UFOVP237_66 [uncultured Caudovirales phage]
MAKLGAALSYNPFEEAPETQAKLGAPVDFNPFEAPVTPDEQELNLPPLQGTPAPNAPMPLARPFDVPLPTPRPSNFDEQPLNASIVGGLVGAAPSAPVMPGIGFGGAPAEPSKKSFGEQWAENLAYIPGALEAKKSIQNVELAGPEQGSQYYQLMQKRLEDAKARGASQDYIDSLQHDLDKFPNKPEVVEAKRPEKIAEIAKTEAQIEAQPKTTFSKTVAEAQKSGNITDLAKGLYDGIKKDPAGAMKEMTGAMIAGAPQVVATIAGGPAGGGIYSQAEGFGSALVEETIKRSPDPEALRKQLAKGDATEFNKIYKENQKEIETAANEKGALSGAFGTAFGLVPGANTFWGGIKNILFKYAPMGTAQSIAENAITQVPVIDAVTGKPKLDENGKVILQSSEGMSPSDIAVAYGIGVATGVPFEVMHLGKKAEGKKGAAPAAEAPTEAPAAQPSPEKPVEAREAGAASPSPEAPPIPIEEAAILKGVGYTIDDILTMNPSERRSIIEEAAASDVKPIDFTEEEKAKLSSQKAAEPEEVKLGEPVEGVPEGLSEPAPVSAPAAADDMIKQGALPLEAMEKAAEKPIALEQNVVTPESSIERLKGALGKREEPAPEQPKTYGDIIGPNRYEPNNGFTLFPGTKQEAHFRFDEYKDYNSIGMGRNELLGEPAKFTSEKDADRRGGNIRPNEMLEKLKDPVLADLFTKFVNKEITKDEFLQRLKETPIKAEANPIPPEGMKAAAEPAPIEAQPAPEPVAEVSAEPVAKPVAAEEAPAPVEPKAPKAPKAPKTPKVKAAPVEKPKTLFSLVRSLGGLKEGDAHRGALRSRDLHRIPGIVNNKTGRSLEDFVINAVEHGYYPEWRDRVLNNEGGVTQQMVDKVLNDLASKRNFNEAVGQRQSEALTDEEEHRLENYKEDIRDLLKDMDHTASDELVHDAGMAMLRGEQDPMRALELAHMGRIAELLPNEGDSIRDITGEDFWNTVEQHRIDKEEEAPRETEQRPTPEAGPAPREEGQPIEQPEGKEAVEGRGKPVEEVRPAQPEKAPVKVGNEIPGTGLSIEHKLLPNLSPKAQGKKINHILKKYFTPGNIVISHGGKDKVIAFKGSYESGNWSATVQQINADGSLENRVRNHSTLPDKKALVQVLGKDYNKDFVVTGDLAKNKALLDKLGFEPVRTINGVPQRVFIGDDPTEAIKAALKPTTEAGVEGKPQTVIPGAERIGEKEQAQRGAEKPLRPKAEQKEPGGLFGDESKQKDLMDLVKAEPKAEPKAPTEIHNSFDNWMKGKEKVSKSPNMPEEYANVLREWADMLGLKGKIHLMLDTDWKAFDSGSYKKPLKHLTNSVGLRSWYAREKASIITMKLKPRRSFNLETLAHELGHVFEKEVWENSSKEEKAAIFADHRRFLKENKGVNIENYIKALRPHVTGEKSRFAPSFKDRDAKTLTPYWRSFSEYFADQIAKYMVSEERPQTVVGKYFARIADGLKRLYNSLAGMQGKARKPIKDYLDRRINGEQSIFDSSDIPSSGKREAPEEPITDMSSSFDQKTIDEIKALNEKYGMEAPEEVPSDVPVETKMGKIKRYFQDEFAYLKKIQQYVESKRGAPLPEAADAYARTNLMPGRTSERIADFQRDKVSPLFKEMKELDISSPDLALYLYAKHAEERNAVMSQRDPKRFGADGGSGMANGTAKEILKKFDNRKPEMEKLAKMVRNILDEDLDRRVEAGLMSQEQADAQKNEYPNYVPLRGFAERDAEEENKMGYNFGRGVSVSKEESKLATGRMSIAENPLLYSILQAEEGIYRIEKNRAAKSLLALARGNPNPDLWTVNKAKVHKEIGADGMVKWIVDGMVGPNTVVAKVGGVPYYIDLKHPGLAEAFKKVGVTQMNPILSGLSKVTRIFSQLQTSKNPGFLAANVIKDFQDAITNAGLQDKRIAKNIPLTMPEAFKIARQEGWGKISDNNQKIYDAWKAKDQATRNKEFDSLPPEVQNKALYDEWRLTGGKISYNNFKDIKDRAAELKAIVGDSDPTTWKNFPLKTQRQAMNVVKSVWHSLDKVGQPFEEMTRLAVYMATRKIKDANGNHVYSPEQAARFSQDFSVNFYRKGKYTPALNAGYAFFNAAVQGDVFLGQKLIGTQGGRKLLFKQMLPAFLMLSYWNQMISKDDETEKGRNNYLNIPENERANNLIIKTGSGPKDYFRIPMPPLLATVKDFADNVALMTTGQRSIPDALTNWVGNAFEAHNPASSSSLIGSLFPTVLKPFYDVTANKSFFGTPIHPAEMPWNKGIPHHEQAFANTSPAASTFTKFLSDATKGGVDIYPGDAEYIVKAMIGGLGKTSGNIMGMIDDMVSGKSMKAQNVPIIKYFAPTGWDESGRYYELHGKFDGKVNQMRKNNVDLAGNNTIAQVRSTDQILKQYRLQLVNNRDNATLTPRQKQLNEDRIKDSMHKLMISTGKMMYNFTK